MWKPSRLYAQNLEDFYLWRIFNYVDIGHYVDVGASLPSRGSVTKIFYDQGWTGINIEPITHIHELLSRERVNDLNFNVACGKKTEILKFWLPKPEDLMLKPELSGASQLDQYHKESNCEQNHPKHIQTDVSVVPLFDILMRSSLPCIHFVKLDVEGAELDVLEGLNLAALPATLKPKVFVIEVNQPFSTELSHAKIFIDAFLRDYSYSEFFYDGLNCYYAKDEECAHFKALMKPINYFDGLPYLPESYHLLEDEVLRLRQSFAELQEKSSAFVSQSIANIDKVNASKTKLEREKLINSILEDKAAYYEHLCSRFMEDLRLMRSKQVHLNEQLSGLLLRNTRLKTLIEKYKSLSRRVLSAIARYQS